MYAQWCCRNVASDKYEVSYRKSEVSTFVAEFCILSSSVVDFKVKVKVRSRLLRVSSILDFKLKTNAHSDTGDLSRFRISCLGPLVYSFQQVFKWLYGFPIFWLWVYLMKIIPEVGSTHIRINFKRLWNGNVYVISLNFNKYKGRYKGLLGLSFEGPKLNIGCKL